jgi:hypothetical protein
MLTQRPLVWSPLAITNWEPALCDVSSSRSTDATASRDVADSEAAAVEATSSVNLPLSVETVESCAAPVGSGSEAALIGCVACQKVPETGWVACQNVPVTGIEAFLTFTQRPVVWSPFAATNCEPADCEVSSRRRTAATARREVADSEAAAVEATSSVNLPLNVESVESCAAPVGSGKLAALIGCVPLGMLRTGIAYSLPAGALLRRSSIAAAVRPAMLMRCRSTVFPPTVSSVTSTFLPVESGCTCTNPSAIGTLGYRRTMPGPPSFGSFTVNLSSVAVLVPPKSRKAHTRLPSVSS